MCCPAPYCRDPVHGQMQWMAGHSGRDLRPRTPAYREIWLRPGRRRPTPTDGSRSSRSTARATCRGSSRWPSACPATIASISTAQDVGLLAVCENFQVVGYNVLVGGGMGVTPRREDTFPALAQPHGLRPARAGGRRRPRHPAVFRDFGNRSRPPPRAAEIPAGRLGTGEVQGRRSRRRLGYAAAAAAARTKSGTSTTTSAGTSRATAAGSTACTSPAGGSPTATHVRLKSALREICRRYQPPLGLTPGQGILLLRRAPGEPRRRSRTCCGGTA